MDNVYLKLVPNNVFSNGMINVVKFVGHKFI